MSKKNENVPLPGRIVRGTSRAGMGGGALLIGLALLLLFRGFGPGGTGSSGSGTGEGTPAPITSGESSPNAEKSETNNSSLAASDPIIGGLAEDEKSETNDSSLAALDPIIGGLTEDERKALSGDMLTVLIDEKQYLIELPGTPVNILRPAELSRIVELASMAKGDSNGIKVRVLIRQTARASAEQQLQADLEHSGIHRDAIMKTSEFAP